MTPDRCPSCADLTALCRACGAIIVEATGEWSEDFARHIAELKAREPEIIRAMLGLDDASLDAAWLGTLAAIHAEGGDPDAILRRAGEVLTAWRDNPYTLTTPEPR